MVTVIVTAGAISAAYGIFQYGILDYNNLDLRVRGSLGHWMTYSGLLTLVIGVALARILFGERDRMWAALVMPALALAIALTFTRTAMVAACATVALLFVLKDLRLLAILPVLAALFFAAAPDERHRAVRVDVQHERSDHSRSGGHAQRRAVDGAGASARRASARPWWKRATPSSAIRRPSNRSSRTCTTCRCRSPPSAGCRAARPGWRSSALRWWTWAGCSARASSAMLAAVALAALVSMLAGGLFEYNFGDSEFLMLLLIVLTLPFAASRSAPRRTHDPAAARPAPGPSSSWPVSAGATSSWSAT